MTTLLILADAGGHSGTVHPRTGPAASDAALFVFAVLAVAIVRKALRGRFAKRD